MTLHRQRQPDTGLIERLEVKMSLMIQMFKEINREPPQLDIESKRPSVVESEVASSEKKDYTMTELMQSTAARKSSKNEMPATTPHLPASVSESYKTERHAQKPADTKPMTIAEKIQQAKP